ncbi:hypothetical protein F2Q70_00042290 [Brassica cretica]|uniref:Peptidase A1 domain-containing protein n=1 Tax=Brassica cretica TaxID=69181 RepID=A0A8S9KFS9_BRACR|nr:hypothetical protein F2Q70_00042290 [Brassica cretica]
MVVSGDVDVLSFTTFSYGKTGNVCLGILNGSEVGLQDSNVIGDISMQGTMVIYDNEKQQLGWVSADCDKLPK